MRFMFALAAMSCLTMGAHPAAAITAEDVMEKMESKERLGYISGLVDMLSYRALLAGDRARAECISNAYYGPKMKDMTLRIVATFLHYPATAPEGIVVQIMKRECGG